MSGHSKWATTKHRKAAVDAKRSALFSKLSRIITVAAKTGGDPNPDNNASLAAAIAKAKSYSLPKDKIQTAIDKAFGAGGGADYEEVTYEGYGPAGVALYVEALTDNRNRTAADVRSAFTRAGGSLGATGLGGVPVRAQGRDRDRQGRRARRGRASFCRHGRRRRGPRGQRRRVRGGDRRRTIFRRVKDALETAGIEVKGAELSMRPKNPAAVSRRHALAR